jgi:hypothetical protein
MKTFYIVLAGDPFVGFDATGPFETPEEAGSVGDHMSAAVGGAEWWVIPLHVPPPARFADKKWREIARDVDVCVRVRGEPRRRMDV